MWNHFFDFWGNRINVASEVSPFHGLWLGCNENISKPQIKVLKLMESVWKLLWIFEFPQGVSERGCWKRCFSFFLYFFHFFCCREMKVLCSNASEKHHCAANRWLHGTLGTGSLGSWRSFSWWSWCYSTDVSGIVWGLLVMVGLAVFYRFLDDRNVVWKAFFKRLKLEILCWYRIPPDLFAEGLPGLTSLWQWPTA